MEVQNLKSYLANVGMSIREFSEKVECTQKYMSLLASGRLTPSKRLARDIYQATGGVVKLKTKAEQAYESQPQNNGYNNHG